MDERKREKKIVKIVKKTALLTGVGVGFLMLSPFLPDIDDPEKTTAMQGLLMSISLVLILQGCLTFLTTLINRDKIFLVDGIMNWLILPTVGLWFLLEAFKVLQN